VLSFESQSQRNVPAIKVLVETLHDRVLAGKIEELGGTKWGKGTCLKDDMRRMVELLIPGHRLLFSSPGVVNKKPVDSGAYARAVYAALFVMERREVR